MILSRVGRARQALEDANGSALADPGNRFAAECLGEVTSARTLLGTFTHNAYASPELIAVGVRPGPAPSEVLCAIGDDQEAAEDWRRELSRSFAPGSVEPITGAPISRSVDSASVDGLDGDGMYAARAEVRLAGPKAQGFLYGALVQGSVLPFLGAPKPIPDGTRLSLPDAAASDQGKYHSHSWPDAPRLVRQLPRPTKRRSRWDRSP